MPYITGREPPAFAGAFWTKRDLLRRYRLRFGHVDYANIRNAKTPERRQTCLATDATAPAGPILSSSFSQVSTYYRNGLCVDVKTVMLSGSSLTMIEARTQPVAHCGIALDGAAHGNAFIQLALSALINIRQHCAG